MNIHEHTTPEKLERYAFLWSLARMVIAAVSLFFGAVPIVYTILGSRVGYSLLPLFWIISGIAAIYLGYQWYKSGMNVFGGQDQKNKIAFVVMVVTGINLGFAGIDTNIGMGLIAGMPVAGILFKLTALIYLFVAWHLFKKWKANGEHLFG